jgi:hypothetical protein
LISDGIIESVGNIALQRFTKFCGTKVVEQIVERIRIDCKSPVLSV